MRAVTFGRRFSVGKRLFKCANMERLLAVKYDIMLEYGPDRVRTLPKRIQLKNK